MKPIILSLLIIIPASLQAAVISRDWKTPGDGLLTYDDVNQREWLNISVSNLDNFDVPKLANALLELEPGALFDEFTLAHSNDVLALAQSAGIDTSTRDFNTNQAATKVLIQHLGVTWGDIDGRFASIGFLDETQFFAGGESRRGATLEVNPFPSGFAGLSLSFSDDRFGRLGSTGLMLYREVIPEPSAVLLGSVIAVMLMLWTWRRSRRHYTGMFRGRIYRRMNGRCLHKLQFEPLESRRVLAAMADIVFLVDESGSEQNTHTQDWLATVIDGLMRNPLLDCRGIGWRRIFSPDGRCRYVCILKWHQDDTTTAESPTVAH